jgi:hypothetical protein
MLHQVGCIARIFRDAGQQNIKKMWPCVVVSGSSRRFERPADFTLADQGDQYFFSDTLRTPILSILIETRVVTSLVLSCCYVGSTVYRNSFTFRAVAASGRNDFDVCGIGESVSCIASQ